MREWIVQGRVLALLAKDNSITTPSADDIFGSVVERKAIWPDVDPGASGEAANLGFSRYPVVPRLILSASEGLPVLSLSGTVQAETVVLNIEDVKVGHIVENGTWYPLLLDIAAEVSTLLTELGLTLGPVHSVRGLLALKKAASTGGPIEDRTAGMAFSPLAFASAVDDAPAGVNASLYDYQTAGWRWLRFLLSERIGGLLADEMGLGKTLQIISVISDSGRETLGAVLVVAPGSLLENWRRELARFAPKLRILKHHGPQRTGRPADLDGYDVVITSYDNVIRDNSLLNMIEWGAVVLDEAQYIRNPDALRTQSVKRLRRRAGLAVTGTPVENRLRDLWSIMDFVLPGYLGDAQSFEQQFGDDNDGARLLEPLVSPVMLRRRVADVAKDLPPRIDIPQVIELEPDEAELYEIVRRKISNEYGKAATLVALTALRQFCAHPILLEKGNGRGDPTGFSKFKRLDELLEEIFDQNEKVIIFTSFTRMADLISAHVRSRHGAFAGCIDGRLAIDDRQPLIDRFSAITGAAALVLNPRAGGAGLNITAANHVIHYNLEWNPAQEDQASARSYRRGQTLPVTVHRLFFAGTVEEVVDERLSRKRELSATAVVGIEGRDEDYADILTALERSPVKR